MPSVGLGQPPPPPPPTGSTAARRFGLTDVEAFKAGRDHSYMYAVPLWNDESPTTPRPSMRPAQWRRAPAHPASAPARKAGSPRSSPRHVRPPPPPRPLPPPPPQLTPRRCSPVPPAMHASPLASTHRLPPSARARAFYFLHVRARLFGTMDTLEKACSDYVLDVGRDVAFRFGSYFTRDAAKAADANVIIVHAFLILVIMAQRARASMSVSLFLF